MGTLLCEIFTIQIGPMLTVFEQVPVMVEEKWVVVFVVLFVVVVFVVVV